MSKTTIAVVSQFVLLSFEYEYDYYWAERQESALLHFPRTRTRTRILPGACIETDIIP